MFGVHLKHTLLDRHVGAELLEYLLTGEPPVFEVQRIVNSTALLYDDLLRQGDARLKFVVPDDAGLQAIIPASPKLSRPGGEMIKNL